LLYRLQVFADPFGAYVSAGSLRFVFVAQMRPPLAILTLDIGKCKHRTPEYLAEHADRRVKRRIAYW